MGLEQRLKQANIETRKIANGKPTPQFDETLFRRDTDFLVAAFTGKEQEATHESVYVTVNNIIGVNYESTCTILP